VTTTVRRTTYREVFAEPVFRILFASRILAIAADTLRIVALSLLVFATTGSALLGAVAFGVGFLPQAIGGTLLGSLADRMPPRTLIVAGYLMECAVATTLGLIDLPVAASLGLVAAVAALTPVFSGASNRLVADRLHGDAYVLGRSVSNVASAGAQLVGLAFGGVAVGALGPHRALLFSAGCHLLAALGVRARLPRMDRPDRLDHIEGRERRDRPTGAPGSAVGQSWSTTRALLGDRRVRGLLLIQWLPPAFATGAEALLIPYAARRGFPTAAAGLLLAAVPLGMLVADVIVGRLVRPAGRERLVAPLVLLVGSAVLGLGLPVPLGVALALLFLLGCGFAYSLGVQRPFLDALPPTQRGQAFALLGTGVMTLQGLGPVLFGAIGQYWSVGAALVVAGLAAMITGAWWWHENAKRDC
jgi:predicted MFS family arabinose efflux permease